MTTTKKIDSLLKLAEKLGAKEVERLALNVLRDNPKTVSEFIMAMGSFFFCDTQGEIIRTSMGCNELKLSRLKGYRKLENFILRFDANLKLTGEEIRLKANGKKIKNW